VLLQAMHDIIGNSVAFFFRQFLTKSAHKFPRAPESKRDGEAQHVSTGAHSAVRTNRERLSIDRSGRQHPMAGAITSGFAPTERKEKPKR
jgi:hypothetical protein